MAERKNISKKVRFEVFKRDGFTCQYCGKKAPEIVLVLDHIKPVAAGGENDILNLLTSCAACNAGKGARELSDTSAVQKQRKQIDELNERREQLEMMIEWRDGLNELDDTAFKAVNRRLSERTNRNFNGAGELKIRKLIRSHGVAAVLEALDIAIDQYCVWHEGKLTQESCELALSKLPGVLRVKKSESEKPYLRELLYIRGILRNRLEYIDERNCLNLLEEAHLAGLSVLDIKDFSKRVRSWTSFHRELQAFIDEANEVK